MNQEAVNLSHREQLERKYASARSNLLLVIILTAVNIVLYFTGSESMLLFSASVPFYGVVFADVLGIGTVGVIVALIVLAIYFLSWLLSKKKPGWLIVALVLFVLDTVCMIAMYFLLEDSSGIADALIHALVLYYLFGGVRAAGKMKNLPDDEDLVPVE